MSNPKIICPCCKTLASGVYGKPYDLPMLDSSKEEIKSNNTDKVILIFCNECEAVLGVYKQIKN